MTARKFFRFPSLLLALTGFLAGTVGSLRAADIKFPADGSGVVFTLPAGWTSKADADADLTISSPDGKFSFKVIGGEPLKDPVADLKETANTIAEHGSVTGLTSETGKEISEPGGLKALSHGFQGKKGGTEITGLLTLFTTAGGTQCLFLVIDSTETVKALDKDLGAIFKSVKAAK